jgi:hypothetical protein
VLVAEVEQDTLHMVGAVLVVLVAEALVQTVRQQQEPQTLVAAVAVVGYSAEGMVVRVVRE